MKVETKIFVIYIGIAGIRSEDIDTYVQLVSKKIIPVTFQGEIIIIPVQDINTRIECINPKYITNDELIKEHTEMMILLKEEIQNQIVQLKEKNDTKITKKNIKKLKNV